MTLGDWLGLAALAFAIWQIIRTRRTAVETKDKVEEVAARISLYNVLLVVPELARVESELERAAIAEHGDDARRLLKEWRELASDLRGMLDSHSFDTTELDSLIQDSLSLANQAKAQLVQYPDQILASTSKVREVIEQVCQETRTLAGRIRVLMGDPDLKEELQT